MKIIIGILIGFVIGFFFLLGILFIYARKQAITQSKKYLGSKKAKFIPNKKGGQ